VIPLTWACKGIGMTTATCEVSFSPPPIRSAASSDQHSTMDQIFQDLSIATDGRGFHDLTPALQERLRLTGLRNGLLQLSCLHTSCSLTVNENADPRVRADLEAHFQALAPGAGSRPISGDGPVRAYSHADEGPDDMPAHLRTALTQTSLGLSFRHGALLLGTWQAVYLWEHRKAADQRRTVVLHWLGTP